MFKHRIRDRVVHVCERCGSVCYSGCAAEALRRQTLDSLLQYGWRLA